MSESATEQEQSRFKPTDLFGLFVNGLQGVVAFQSMPDWLRVVFSFGCLLAIIALGFRRGRPIPAIYGWSMLICLAILFLSSTTGRSFIADVQSKREDSRTIPAYVSVVPFSDDDADGVRDASDKLLLDLPVLAHDKSSANTVSTMENRDGKLDGALVMTSGDVVTTVCGISQVHNVRKLESSQAKPILIEVGVDGAALKACGKRKRPS